jgi:hypothetical protein
MSRALDTGTKPLNPDECVKLLESKELDVQQTPVEVGRDWKTIVEPPDHGMIAMLIAHVCAAAKEIDLPDEEDIMSDDEGGRPRATSTHLKYQVTKMEKSRRYSLVVEFPEGSHFRESDIVAVATYFPNRIIQKESEPIVTANKLLGYRWTITTHEWFLYARASQILLLHDAPEPASVMHAFADPVGRRHEGRGVKRMREAEDLPDAVFGRKTQM